MLYNFFDEFDFKYKNKQEYTNANISEHLKENLNLKIKNEKNEKNENYYKAKLIYALTKSKFYNENLFCSEANFPKGNKSSANLKIDTVIFSSKEWKKHYQKWWNDKDSNSLDWLNKNIICVIETKNEELKNIEDVYRRQLKPALKTSENYFGLGIIFDADRLYLFKKKGENVIRYNDSYNENSEKSTTSQLSLDLTDAYLTLPNHKSLSINLDEEYHIKISNKNVDQLETISKIQGNQMNDALAEILKSTDRNGYKSQKGYEILIQVLALKIYDEKYNKTGLQFYIEEEEKNYDSINDTSITRFLNRFKKLIKDASSKYHKILDEIKIDLTSKAIVNILITIVNQFQIYSFIRSTNTDLYQLIFYKFASEFSKVEKKQFTTPLRIIDFMVKIINPKKKETIIDPTCGIGDFLSSAYVNSKMTLDDNNIFGADNDRQMIELAELNMLLNGDGNANLEYLDDEGSIFRKFNEKNEIVELNSNLHKNGDWDNWNDKTLIKKFDIVLTNPPFGKNRSMKPNNSKEKERAEIYELWNIARDGQSIDKGLIFLENTVKILKENGRFGIILSNSLASVETWKDAREWLTRNIRIVGLFDLPANVFADTGVNTTIIMGYKPNKQQLLKLNEQNYEIFVHDIQKVGYEIITNNKVKEFVPKFKRNFKTFEVEQDKEGNPILDEEFSKIIDDFKKWKLNQESKLAEIF